MVVIASSSLRLEPGEATQDPLLTGITRIEKQIGDRTLRAWVDSRLVQQRDGSQTLECFPNRHGHPLEPEPVRTVRVNEWTTWKLTPEEFSTLQWVDRYPRQSVTITPQDQQEAARTAARTQADQIARSARALAQARWEMPDGADEILERISRAAGELRELLEKNRPEEPAERSA